MATEVMIQIFESDFNNDGLVQTVNARDLHEALGIKRQFANWIKDALQDFQENQDFIIFNANVNKSVRGRPTQDYALTLDTAKHICMMSRCEKGKQLRQYFIEAEKQFRLGNQPEAVQTNPDALPGTPEHFAYTFALAYKQVYGATNQQPVIEHDTEPEQLPPVPVTAVKEWHPCPSHKINMNQIKEYVSNETLVHRLLKLFGVVGDEHDYGYTETGIKVKPGLVYDRMQVLAILKAAQVRGQPIEGKDKQYKLMGFRFTVKKAIQPRDYDSETFEIADKMLQEELNHH